MSIALKHIERVRILTSKEYWTEIEVHVEKIEKERFKTSKLVIKNLNIDNFEEELLSKWSILWNILRCIIKEMNKQVDIKIDVPKYTEYINKLERNEELIWDEKTNLIKLFENCKYRNLLRDMFNNNIIIKEIKWSNKSKLTFNYIRKIVMEKLSI
jgi:hypothetical protein